MLAQSGIISNNLSIRLKSMVGFRNIAILDYQAVQLEIVQKIIESHLTDFEEYLRVVRKFI